MAVVLPNGRNQFDGVAGGPGVGYKLYTYVAGTSTPKSTYTTSTASVANTNPVVMDARGEAAIYWVGSYDVTLKTDADVTVWGPERLEQFATDSELDAFIADLASTVDAGKGAALSGYNSTLLYPANTVGWGLNTASDGVNVLRYIPVSEWAAIFAYTSTTDLATYLQSALTAEKNLVFPDGRYNTSTKLTLRTDSRIRGLNRRGPQIRATANVTIFELPYLSVDVELSRLYFCSNTNNTGIGVAVAATAGTFQGYATSLHIHGCDFAPELSYGMDIDPIVSTIEHSSFGIDSTTGYNPSPGTSTFVAMRAQEYPATSNATNVNVFRRNKVFRAGSLTVAGIQINAGAHWVIEGNDIEQGGVAISLNDVNRTDIVQNWFEGNVSTNEMIVISGSAKVYTLFERNHVAGNTVNTANRGIINYASTIPCVIDIVDNDFGKDAGTYCIYDNATTIRTLDGAGNITFYDNTVSGDTVGDTLVSSTDFRGGPMSPRISAIIDTSGAGTIVYCTDPSATLVRTGTGDVTLQTISNPLATANNKVRVSFSAATTNAIRLSTITTTSIRLQGFTDAGAAADGVFHITAYGS